MDQELEIINLDLILDKRKNNPCSPWKRARKLEEEKAAEFLTMQDIYNGIEKFDNPRDKALYIIIYLCAARIEEVTRYTPIKWGKSMFRVVRKGKAKNTSFVDYKKKNVYPTQPSMTKENFSLETRKGKPILVIRIRNLKNKQKWQNVKLIPLPLNDEISQKFKEIIDIYLLGLKEHEELFPITKRRAEQIILKVGFNPHFLRKCRLTHLVKYYNFNDQKLKTFAGWTDSRPAKHYIRITWEDLVDSM